MVQREWLEWRKGAKGPFWQELESVLFQVDGRGLAGKLFGQISQTCSVTQNTATPLLCAGAGWRTGPHTGPTGHDPLRQQPQHWRWKDQILKYQWTEDNIYLQLSLTFPCVLSSVCSHSGDHHSELDRAPCPFPPRMQWFFLHRFWYNIEVTLTDRWCDLNGCDLERTAYIRD